MRKLVARLGVPALVVLALAGCGSSKKSTTATTSTIAAAIQRPGRRTGTARICSGRPAWSVTPEEDTPCALS